MKLIGSIETQDIAIIHSLILSELPEASVVCIERMGGLTNRTYKVTLSNRSEYAIRVPGAGTEELINRVNERISTTLACRLGIDTDLLYFDKTGIKITKFIDDAKTMTAEDISLKDNLTTYLWSEYRCSFRRV